MIEANCLDDGVNLRRLSLRVIVQALTLMPAFPRLVRCSEIVEPAT